MKFLRFLMFLLRFFFGMVYLLSGFFKFVDPVGTKLLIEEYLMSMHLGFLDFIATPLALLLPVVEFIIGIAILMCLRMKYISIAGLIMTGFFTILTFFSAQFSLVSECGCFGEAIPTDNWETFFKNLILLGCIIPIFIFRNKFHKVAPAKAEWALLGAYGGVALIASVYSFINIPFIEFGEYKVGTNISIKLENITDTKMFESQFIYEKEGKEGRFSLDNLPDDSWNFVRSESVYLGDEDDLRFSMNISDLSGASIANEIAHRRAPAFLFSIYRPEKLKESYYKELSHAIDSILVSGGMPYIMVHNIDSTIRYVCSKYPHIEPYLVIADQKTMISMVRSNGGAIYIEDGIVVKKWARRQFDPKEIIPIIETDTEEITLTGSVRQTLIYELCILTIFFIIIIFRYICGIIYGKKFKIIQLPKMMEAPAPLSEDEQPAKIQEDEIK